MWWFPGCSSNVMLETVARLTNGLAMYCSRVKQGSPVNSPGQGLSGVGMMLNMSQLAYWTVLFKRNNIVNKIHLSISVHTVCDAALTDYLYNQAVSPTAYQKAIGMLAEIKW